MKTLIVVTGGGSGGHLNAALSVISYWQKNNPLLIKQIAYIGGYRGMIGDPTPSIESRKVPEVGVKFYGIRTGKLHRKLSIQTLLLLFGVIGGFWDSFWLLRRLKPKVLFSTGGYVTVPVVLMAKILGIKVLIHEQTVVSGLANRIASRFADKVLLTFPESEKFFSSAKTLLVGGLLQPSRFDPSLPENLETDYAEFLQRQKELKKSKKFIFFTGGGLGSHRLNEFIMANLKEITEEYTILVQTGENRLFDDYSKLNQAKSSLPKNQQENVWITAWFGKEIGYIYKHSDVVVARPGANTVLELLATNNRAVLFPILWSSGNEQQANAEYFCSRQAGIVVDENRLGSELLPAIRKVLTIPRKDTRSEYNASAVSDVSDLVLKHVR